MPVGFGYIRDEQPAIVDWSAITREARDTIKGIEADRQAKREGVDQAIRDQSEALINRPKSQNTEYNSAMSNMTAQIEATMLQNYNDLRLGNINLNQFNATKNTMMSETKGVLAIAKVYADQYDANVEGAQNGTLSGFSNWTNAMTQEMMDFQGVETFVGPNGKISFVKKKEDGTTETLDTSELFTLANMKQQKFDMNAEIEKAKEKGGFTYRNNLGEETKGYFIDPLTGKEDTNAISKAAASMVAQDSNAYGILYDYIGGYDFKRLSDDFFAENQTGEEQKAALGQLQKENKNVIYIDSNGMPIVSESQRNVAQEYVKEQLEQVAVTSKQEAGFLAEEIQRAKLTQLEKNNELIDAKLAELNYDNDKRLKIGGALTDYFGGLTKSNIETALSTASGNPAIQREGEISRTLTGVLAPFGVTIQPGGGMRQAIEVTIPGQEVPVEIYLRNKTADAIVAEITGALFGLEADVLDEIYEKRIVKSNSESTETTSNEEDANVENDVDAEGLPIIIN